ncbi:ABC transporter [Streptomyces sp. SKN60]|uniref:ABC transporter n=1 Tax=Streptomyces sp. SKN60 TaxID=2855506 RepID=UPI00224649F8|nr:ABC transporter [Streptomyces sp. SKN60]MCX2185143.1 ABC transporter [Streptomyces sp. SKN60]
MSALLRYQAALLLRSQRWLAPFLLYAAFVGVGIQAGEPVLGALGYAVAGLVPVAAWAVRICLDQEPPAARTVIAAAAGRARAHLAAVLTATGAVLLVGVTAVLAVTGMSDHRLAGPLPAAVAGVLGATVCVLTGTAIGALTTRPLIRARGWSLTALLLASLLGLVATGSPAASAVSSLVAASTSGAVPYPWPALAGAVALTAAAVTLACRATAWRG